jgi:hypothetical protein
MKSSLGAIREAMLPDIVNIKDYGALGDHSHDDTTAWNAAVTAANATGMNSAKMLVLPMGIYDLDPESLVHANCDVWGPSASLYSRTNSAKSLFALDGWFHEIRLTGIFGYGSNPTTMQTPHPTTLACFGNGLQLGKEANATYNKIHINYVYGFNKGIYLDGDTGGSHVASNQINIDCILSCDRGVAAKTRISQVENNIIDVRFIAYCGYLLECLQSATPTGSAYHCVQNEFKFGAPELYPYATGISPGNSGNVGVHMSGDHCMQNKVTFENPFYHSSATAIAWAENGAINNILEVGDFGESDGFLATTLWTNNIVRSNGLGITTGVNGMGRSEIWGTAAPTLGVWRSGDRCWNSTPAAGGPPGWVCTTGGGYGVMVWKAMPNLAA